MTATPSTLPLGPAELLTTTRSVRKWLDPGRPADHLRSPTRPCSRWVSADERLQQLFMVQVWGNGFLDGASWVGPTWSISAE